MFNWKMMLTFTLIGAAIGLADAYLTKSSKWLHAAVYGAFGALTAWGAMYLPAKKPSVFGVTPKDPAAAAAAPAAAPK
jgi:hypothetical protein